MPDYKIDKRNVEDMMGLTAMQEGMLFHYLTYPGSKQYFEQFRFRLSGKLDVEVFKAAWQAAAQTNEMLRSVIRWERLEEPVQVVLKEKELPIRVEDLSGAQKGDPPGLLEQLVETDKNTPIDLTQAPLRITLCILDPEESEMILTFHHILYDGWSNGIVLREFLEVYNGLLKGEEPAVIEKTRYKEFYRWYCRQLQGQLKQAQDEFWKTCLDGFAARTSLPYDKSKLEGISRVKTHKIRVSREIKQRLDSCGREHNITPSAFIYTAWGLLLQKYNNSDDIIFGTTVSGRPPAVKGIQEMVGLFINTLPLRLQAVGEEPVMEVLRRLGRHLEARIDFQHSSLAGIRKFSGIGSDSDLFDSIIVIDNYPLDTVLNREGSLVIRSYDMFEMTNFDLTLQVLLVEDIDHLPMDFHYNADLFAAETVERLSRHFINVLAGITAGTAQNVSEVDMLPPEEKQRILNEFNEPEIEFLIAKTVHGVIEDQVEKTPDNVAVVGSWQLAVGKEKIREEPVQLSYRELNDQANRLAHMLADMGVSENSRVVMMFPRSVDMIAAVLGILKAGAACIPLDIGHPDERNRFIIGDSEAGFFLKHREVTFAGIDHADVREIHYDLEELSAYSPDNPGRAVQPADLSYIIYTSGSTGNPKGALLHHSGIVNHTYSKIDVLGITGADTVASSFSINVIAAVWQILSPLFTGARLVVYSEEIEWDPYGQFQRVAADGVTVIEMIPPVLKAYLFMLEEGKEKINLEGLRKIALTSEETKPFVVNKFYQAYPSGIDLVDCYGMTECCDDVLHYTIPADTDTKKVPIGTPALNTKVLVLNHHGQLQPVGVPGEICVIGAGVGYGYWNRKELTAEKFDQDFWDYQDYQDKTETSASEIKQKLLRGGQGGSNRSPLPGAFLEKSPPGRRRQMLYRTGDLGRWLANGVVEYLGRLDHQVKVRGNRVELREIENHIIRYEAVKEAAVIARDNEEGDTTLYAFIAAGVEITVPGIRQFLLKTLPDYMVPAHFVPLDELPLTPNGKIDRKVLAKIEIKTGIGTGTVYQPARNELETKIRDVWTRLLAGKSGQIGMNDNFFDLGGHSLLLIKLKSKLEKVFALNREISIIELFNYPTIARQAEFIEKVKSGIVEGVKEKEEEKRGPLSRDIAVIGISLKVPGASNIGEFWENLRNGIESISFFREEELEGAPIDRYVQGVCKLVPAYGILGDVDLFDADFFGFNPREAEIMDPQQRLFLQYAWMAMEDAGYAGDSYPGRVGVYAGTAMNTYILNNVMAHPEVVNAVGEFQTMIANDKDFLATRVSYKLNLRGPAVTVQTACSTSLVAVHLAKQALLNDECDMVLAGGAAVSIPERSGYFYNEGGYLSPDGHCRAFAAGANGTVFGSGIGVVVLKPLEKAVRDNDFIYAVIKGSGVNNDGSLKVGYTGPGEIGQAGAILQALRESGVAPETVGYVETHGTGTVLGDPVEVAALGRAFSEAGGGRETGRVKGYCALTSLKSNIGHLDTAAGVVGLIKAVLCLRHKQIPPSINVEEPNPLIDFGSTPFYVNRELADWPCDDGTPRRAGVSSFGIGGTNAHVVLEEWADDRKPGGQSADSHLILLSGRTEEALHQVRENLVQHLKKNPDINLGDAAYVLAVGRKAFEHRLATVCRDREDALRTLEDFNPKRIVMHTCREGEKSVVFMFPGIGEHYVNMTAQLYAGEPVFQEEVDRCREILNPILGRDLREVLYVDHLGGPKRPAEGIDLRKLVNRETVALSEEESVLSQTLYAHTAVFTVEYALARLLMSWGIKPRAMIGYSLGEYTAACISGVFSLEDVLSLVAERAKLIHALEQGAMTAVSLAEAQLAPLVEAVDGVSTAAVNTPDLCIVSGQLAGIRALENRLQERNVIYRRLKAFQAFHSPMMEAVRPGLTALFTKAAVKARAPVIPYISNVTGTWITAGQVASADYWITHTVSPIRFSRGISELLSTTFNFFLEVGPGNSLCGFTARHPKNETVSQRFALAAMPKESENAADRAFLLRTLGKLWAAGLEIDRVNFNRHGPCRRIPLPTYPFAGKRYWLEPGAAAAGGIAKKENIDEWFYVPCWKQSIPPLASRGRAVDAGEKRWLVFMEESPISTRLIQQLKLKSGHAGSENEVEITAVKMGERFEKLDSGGGGVCDHTYVVHPGRYRDYEALLEDLREQGRGFDIVVHLWLLTPTPGGETAESLERGFYGPLYLVQAMGRQAMFDKVELWMVSNHLHKIESSDMCNPGKAVVLGPGIVISQEYPNILCRSIDTGVYTYPYMQTRDEKARVRYDEETAALVDMLLAEFAVPGTERIIAFRGPHRWVQRFEPVKPPKSEGFPALLKEGGVYLITGGLGRIGLTIAGYLARNLRAKLVLTGRSGVSLSGKGERIRRLEEMGGEVLVKQADAADPRQMKTAVQEAEERFGKINGVIHAAGVMDPGAFKLIAHLEEEHCRGHFNAKIRGTLVLEEVFRDRDLDFCLLTSSLSPLLGGLGLYAYSAANSFMDGFAHQQSLVYRKNWISINWADWEPEENPGGGDHGMNALVGTTTAALNITPEQGEETLARVLAFTGLPQIVVSSGDLHRRLRQWVTAGSGEAEADTDGSGGRQKQTVHKRPQLQSIYEAPKNEAEKIVVEIWQELLGIEQVGVHDNFFELGGHSLIATKLISRLREIFRIDIPLPTLFDRPTIREVVDNIARTWGDAETVKEIARTYREFQLMS